MIYFKKAEWHDLTTVDKVISIIACAIFSGLVIVFLLFVNGCRSLNPDGYLRPDYVDPRKQRIVGAGGEDKGYLIESWQDPRVTIQYDRKGNSVGHWRKDYVDPRKTNFYKKK